MHNNQKLITTWLQDKEIETYRAVEAGIIDDPDCEEREQDEKM